RKRAANSGRKTNRTSGVERGPLDPTFGGCSGEIGPHVGGDKEIAGSGGIDLHFTRGANRNDLGSAHLHRTVPSHRYDNGGKPSGQVQGGCARVARLRQGE